MKVKTEVTWENVCLLGLNATRAKSFPSAFNMKINSACVSLLHSARDDPLTPFVVFISHTRAYQKKMSSAADCLQERRICNKYHT